MHIPSILPDEHSKGYQGRIRRLNGDVPLVTLRKHLVTMLNVREKKLESYNIVEALALASGEGLERFVRNHTLMPFLRIVHSGSAGTVHGTPRSYRQLTQAGLVVSDRRAKLCLDCVNEDQLVIGTAYWRRLHQLPGVVFCSTHQSILFEVHRDAPALGMPNEFVKHAHRIDDDVALAATQSEVILRYFCVCDAFLRSESSVHYASAAMRIAQQASKALPASELGFALPGRLNDLAISIVGGPWLEKFFPTVKDGKSNRAINIDSVTQKSSSTHASSYALALSLLWDSPEAAYSEFTRPAEGAERAAIISSISLPGQEFASENRSPTSGPAAFRNLKRALRAVAAGSSLGMAGRKFNICSKKLETIVAHADVTNVVAMQRLVASELGGAVMPEATPPFS